MPKYEFDRVGVQLYKILPDTCLNGRYINTDTGEVFNEIAKKKDRDNSKDIFGKYLCSYHNQEAGEEITICNGTLTISPGVNNKMIFDWHSDNGSHDWTGEGWEIGENLIIVKYRKP